jgi:hypothetical protein
MTAELGQRVGVRGAMEAAPIRVVAVRDSSLGQRDQTASAVVAAGVLGHRVLMALVVSRTGRTSTRRLRALPRAPQAWRHWLGSAPLGMVRCRRGQGLDYSVSSVVHHVALRVLSVEAARDPRQPSWQAVAIRLGSLHQQFPGPIGLGEEPYPPLVGRVNPMPPWRQDPMFCGLRHSRVHVWLVADEVARNPDDRHLVAPSDGQPAWLSVCACAVAEASKKATGRRVRRRARADPWCPSRPARRRAGGPDRVRSGHARVESSPEVRSTAVRGSCWVVH